MSISRIGIISAAALLFPAVTMAQTAPQASENVWTMVPSADADAQVVNLTLSETDTRRLSHYSAQTLLAIYELGGTSPDQNTAIGNLRQKVARLIDAGTRCGYTTDQTAEFFKAYVEEHRTKDLPAVLNGSDGKIEALQLFVSVEEFNLQSQPETIDVAAVMAEDLEGIKSVAINTSPLQAEPDSLQLTVTALPDEVQRPVIPENADTATRAVLARVEVRGDEWVIEVKQGDSLAQFAYALFRDRLRFNEIYTINRDVLSSPNLLKLGQILVLPRNG